MDTELKTEFRLDDDLLLRAWREDDVETVVAKVLDNRDHLQPFMHWMTSDYSIESARTFLTDSIKAREERKNLGLGIFSRGDLIGSIGFVGFDWMSRRTEIGYWIDKYAQGKGVITRACRSLIDYAFDELALNRIEIRCSTENNRSAAIPERLGFTLEGVLRKSEMRDGKFHDFNIYGLLADDRRLW